MIWTHHLAQVLEYIWRNWLRQIDSGWEPIIPATYNAGWMAVEPLLAMKYSLWQPSLRLADKTHSMNTAWKRCKGARNCSATTPGGIIKAATHLEWVILHHDCVRMQLVLNFIAKNVFRWPQQHPPQLTSSLQLTNKDEFVLVINLQGTADRQDWLFDGLLFDIMLCDPVCHPLLFHYLVLFIVAPEPRWDGRLFFNSPEQAGSRRNIPFYLFRIFLSWYITCLFRLLEWLLVLHWQSWGWA